MEKGVNRRDFVKSAAAVSLGSVLLSGSSVFAAGSDSIRVAVVGCGGRGAGALGDFFNAAKHMNMKVEVVGLADYFIGRAKGTAQKYGISEDLCLEGPLAYKDIMKTNADIVILATPPIFRPVHFEAAVKAGKHVFMEKPVAVDPPGVRQIIAAGKIAADKKLSVIAGTQRRHQEQYVNTYNAIQAGAIGKIRAANVWWCGGKLWYAGRNPGEDDASYLVRNWVSFAEMSGDHIVEQHIHNIDVANWFIGRYPKEANGFGGRARRRTGNQFDFFSVDFDYGDDVKVHSMCRQIDGCYTRVSENFVGTDGSTWGSGPDNRGYANNVSYDKMQGYVGNPYVQEHVDLLKSVTSGNAVNVSEEVASSNLAAIMGRISAYTGNLVRWKDLMDNDKSPYFSLTMSPGPLDFETGSVKAPQDEVAPIPGK